MKKAIACKILREVQMKIIIINTFQSCFSHYFKKLLKCKLTYTWHY